MKETTLAEMEANPHSENYRTVLKNKVELDLKSQTRGEYRTVLKNKVELDLKSQTRGEFC